jgi:peptidoglycan-associated lipoprotein
MSWSLARNSLYVLLFVAALFTTGCHKKVAGTPLPTPPAAPPTPPPPAPPPTITLRAEPSTIDRGSATMLQWEARNAATVTITPGVGEVALMGNRSVNPTSSVTYTASAIGPGGTANDIARVTVNVPAAPAEPTPARRPDVSISALFDQNVKDVLFDYDKADIKPDQVSVLQGNAGWLKTNTNVRFTIEGHCDDRGSEEYNLGLGDRRANAVKEYLVSQGVAVNRISVVSYGEERPICREESEACYTRNRRAHFALSQ